MAAACDGLALARLTVSLTKIDMSCLQVYSFFYTNDPSQSTLVYYASPSGTTPTTVNTSLRKGSYYTFDQGYVYSDRYRVSTTAFTAPQERYLFDWTHGLTGFAALSDTAFYMAVRDQGALLLTTEASFPSLYGWSSTPILTGLDMPGMICGISGGYLYLLTGSSGLYQIPTKVTKINLASLAVTDIVTGLTNATACAMDASSNGDLIVAVGNTIKVLPGGSAPLSAARVTLAAGAVATSVQGLTSTDSYLVALAGTYTNDWSCECCVRPLHTCCFLACMFCGMQTQTTSYKFWQLKCTLSVLV